MPPVLCQLPAQHMVVVVVLAGAGVRDDIGMQSAACRVVCRHPAPTCSVRLGLPGMPQASFGNLETGVWRTQVGCEVRNAAGEVVRVLDKAEPNDMDHVAYLTRETVSQGHSVLIFCATKVCATRWACLHHHACSAVQCAVCWGGLQPIHIYVSSICRPCRFVYFAMPAAVAQFMCACVHPCAVSTDGHVAAPQIACEKEAKFIANVVEVLQRSAPPTPGRGNDAPPGTSPAGSTIGSQLPVSTRESVAADLRRLDPGSLLPDVVARGVAYHHGGMYAATNASA